MISARLNPRCLQISSKNDHRGSLQYILGKDSGSSIVIVVVVVIGEGVSANQRSTAPRLTISASVTKKRNKIVCSVKRMYLKREIDKEKINKIEIECCDKVGNKIEQR